MTPESNSLFLNLWLKDSNATPADAEPADTDEDVVTLFDSPAAVAIPMSCSASNEQDCRKRSQKAGIDPMYLDALAADDTAGIADIGMNEDKETSLSNNDNSLNNHDQLLASVVDFENSDHHIVADTELPLNDEKFDGFYCDDGDDTKNNHDANNKVEGQVITGQPVQNADRETRARATQAVVMPDQAARHSAGDSPPPHYPPPHPFQGSGFGPPVKFPFPFQQQLSIYHHGFAGYIGQMPMYPFQDMNMMICGGPFPNINYHHQGGFFHPSNPCYQPMPPAHFSAFSCGYMGPPFVNNFSPVSPVRFPVQGNRSNAPADEPVSPDVKNASDNKDSKAKADSINMKDSAKETPVGTKDDAAKEKTTTSYKKPYPEDAHDSDDEDDDKPCRPLHAYNMFFRMERKKIMAEQKSKTNNTKTAPGGGKIRIRNPQRVGKHANVGFANLTRIISQRWNNLESTPDGIVLKNALEEKCLKDREQYKKDMAVWKAKKKKERKIRTSTALGSEGRDEDRTDSMKDQAPRDKDASSSAKLDFKTRVTCDSGNEDVADDEVENSVTDDSIELAVNLSQDDAPNPGIASETEHATIHNGKFPSRPVQRELCHWQSFNAPSPTCHNQEHASAQNIQNMMQHPPMASSRGGRANALGLAELTCDEFLGTSPMGRGLDADVLDDCSFEYSGANNDIFVACLPCLDDPTPSYSRNSKSEKSSFQFLTSGLCGACPQTTNDCRHIEREFEAFKLRVNGGLNGDNVSSRRNSC